MNEKLKLQNGVDVYQRSSTEWVYTKTIMVHGVELGEYDRYWLDQVIHDYRRSLPEYRARVKAKRRRKIERKQKRAAFRRKKRGLA